MAIYRFELKHVTRSKGLSAKVHANYITRNGAPVLEQKHHSASGHAQYLERSLPPSRDDKSEDLEHVEHGNMPIWAVEKPQKFWDAADKFERSNGRLYSEMLVSLPRELSRDERIELTREFVQKELGDRHPYSFAIHNSTALDGGEQPHAHIMFSERTQDGIERGPVHFFKRADTVQPELGGAVKDRSWNARDKISELRESWEQSANDALERAGLDIRLDHRSLEDRGIDRMPEPKLGRDQTAMLRNGDSTERGATVIELRVYRERVATLEKQLEQTEREISELNEKQAQQIERGKAVLARNQQPDEQGILLRMAEREAVQVASDIRELNRDTGLHHSVAYAGHVEGRVVDRVSVGRNEFARVDIGNDQMSLVPWDDKLSNHLGQAVRLLVASEQHPMRRLRIVRIVDRELERDDFGHGFGGFG